MQIYTRLSGAVAALFLAFGLLSPIAAQAATTAPALGAAAGYSIYSDAGITNTGVGTHLWGKAGDNGVGHPGLLVGQVDSGIIDAGVGVAGAAGTAYATLDLGSQTPVAALNLNGNHTVTPGVYTVGATALTGTLTLDGAGVYIFRSSSSVSVSGAGTMSLINGATACNVFWEIPTSMTIDNAGHIEGTIIAQTGNITFANGASLVGRALAHTAITLDTNSVTEPVCGSSPSPAVSTNGSIDYFGTLPLIHLTKVPSPLSLSVAGIVTYTYTVTNTGKVPLTTIGVTDNKCSPVTYVSGDTNSDAYLDLTETWIYRCSKTVSQTEMNTATAHGYANNEDVYSTATATVVVSTPIQSPVIVVTAPIGQVLGASTSTPSFPNTGLPPRQASASNILVLVSIIAAVSIALWSNQKSSFSSLR